MVFLLRKIVNGRFLLTFLIFLIFVFCFLKLSGIKQKKRVKFKASSSAETIEPTTKEQCDLIPSGLIGVFDIIAPPELDFFSQDTKLRLRGVENGGSSSPRACNPQNRMAIVVPYRNRLPNLKIFLWNIHRFFQRQELEYTVYIVEQAGDKTFNKGILMNAAFREIFELRNVAENREYDCIMYHDVDLIPTEDKIIYQCPEKSPRHYSSLVDRKDWSKVHNGKYVLVGGVISYYPQQYIDLNGYSNLFWGWGGEDDDMTYRLKKSGIWYERPVKHLRYTMTKHKKQAKNPERRKLLMDIKNDKRSYTDEGLNSVEYKLLSWTKYPLHTHLMVDVGEAPQKK